MWGLSQPDAIGAAASRIDPRQSAARRRVSGERAVQACSHIEYERLIGGDGVTIADLSVRRSEACPSASPCCRKTSVGLMRIKKRAATKGRMSFAHFQRNARR